MTMAEDSIKRSLVSSELYFREEIVEIVKHVYETLVGHVGLDNIDVELFGAAVDDFVSLPEDQISPLVMGLRPEVGKWRKPGECAPRLVRSAVRQETWLTASHRDSTLYLRWILELVKQSQSPTIATLNYDNAIELCSSTNARFDYSYGLENEWRTHMPIEFPSDRIALIKLHGSSNWSLGDHMPVEKGLIFHGSWNRFKLRIFSQLELDRFTAKRVPVDPALLFGRGIKMRYPGPFISLYDSFRKRLHLHRNLVVVGYSFRDAHINDDIANWLDVDSARRVIIVSPSATANFVAEVRKSLAVESATIVAIQESVSSPRVGSMVADAIGHQGNSRSNFYH